jgi:hypothetical protein
VGGANECSGVLLHFADIHYSFIYRTIRRERVLLHFADIHSFMYRTIDREREPFLLHVALFSITDIFRLV